METTSVPALAPVLPKLLSPGRLAWACSLALGLGLTLALGFLPTCLQLASGLRPHLTFLPRGQTLLPGVLFPLCAWLFCASVPATGGGPVRPVGGRRLIQMSLLPLGIALVFGVVLARMRTFSSGGNAFSEAIWWVILAPIGEEFLFRGWCYEIYNRLFPRVFLSLSNPLPLSIWLSSFAFSVWHVQNFGTVSLAFVLFQVAYTFCAGLWLGYLRWHSGGVLFPASFHVLMNLMAIAPQLLC